jgi:YHS domain-containing protein
MLKLIKLIAIALVLVFSFTQTFAQTPVNTNASGVFLDGYDVVSYFTENKPRRGSSAISTQWHDATLFFVSEENKRLFLDSPDEYWPQFEGHCANGLSDGHLVGANPEIYRIIDGKLYLFYSWWGKAQWKFDQPEQIKLANEYWTEFTGK